MGDKDGKNPVGGKAPTYNELVSLVDRLTSQLKVADGNAAVLEEIAKLKSSLDAKVELEQSAPTSRASRVPRITRPGKRC